MKQIKIPDKLHHELRMFCDKQDVPLKDYIEGVLETSMLFPDGIEIPESFTTAKTKNAQLAALLRGVKLGDREGFSKGVEKAIWAIIRSEGWIFQEMSKFLGFITVGNENIGPEKSDNTGISVSSFFLQNTVKQVLKDARRSALDRAAVNNHLAGKTF